MALRDVDVVVIGLGPGGEDVAGSLAEAGLDVVGIERELLGGECPYWGCVPSKMIIRGADAIAEARRLHDIAGDATVVPDYAPIAARIRREATDNWDDTVAVDRFVGKGGHFERGAARITAPGVVEVNGSEYRARRGIVLATGATASVPPIPGIGDVEVWNNRDAMRAEVLPSSLVVLGGGAIGVEIAQAWARFGVTVTVVEGAASLVPAEEPEAGIALQQVLTDEGVMVRTGAGVLGITSESGAVALTLKDGTVVRGERLLVAAGRRAATDGLGLELVKVAVDHGIVTDDRMRAAPGVWAVGDCTQHGGFTHMAMYHAGIVTADILDTPHAPAAYHAVPRVTFTDPEIGAVGLTEAQARAAGVAVKTGTTQTSSSARGWIHGPGNAGFIKVVADSARDVLVGATSMGPSGGEVLSMLTLAVHARLPVASLREMVYAYPTFHRGIEDALRDLATPR